MNLNSVSAGIAMSAPDYCAENDCGKDKLPVQLVLVGEATHAQEEEDDAVAEKAKDDIRSFSILPRLGDSLGRVVDGDIAVRADVGHCVPGR